MKLKSIFCILAALILLAACRLPACKNKAYQTKKPKTDFDRLAWLEGCWKGSDDGMDFYEVWRRDGDTLLVNYRMEILNGDTLVNKGEMIRYRKGAIFLGNDSVRWHIVSLSDNEVIFKNMHSAFGHKIIWQLTPDSNWVAAMERLGDRQQFELQPVPDILPQLDQLILQSESLRQGDSLLLNY